MTIGRFGAWVIPQLSLLISSCSPNVSLETTIEDNTIQESASAHSAESVSSTGIPPVSSDSLDSISESWRPSSPGEASFASFENMRDHLSTLLDGKPDSFLCLLFPAKLSPHPIEFFSLRYEYGESGDLTALTVTENFAISDSEYGVNKSHQEANQASALLTCSFFLLKGRGDVTLEHEQTDDYAFRFDLKSGEETAGTIEVSSQVLQLDYLLDYLSENLLSVN